MLGSGDGKAGAGFGINLASQSQRSQIVGAEEIHQVGGTAYGGLLHIGALKEGEQVSRLVFAGLVIGALIPASHFLREQQLKVGA